MGVSAENRTGVGISESQRSGVEFLPTTVRLRSWWSAGSRTAPAAEGSSTDPAYQSETASEIPELPFIRSLT